MARLETLACHLVPAWLATSDWVEQSLNNVVGEPVLARVQGQSLADSEHTTAPLGGENPSIAKLRDEVG